VDEYYFGIAFRICVADRTTTWLLIPNKLLSNGGWDLLVEGEHEKKWIDTDTWLVVPDMLICWRLGFVGQGRWGR
jgi:hypothetical protein